MFDRLFGRPARGGRLSLRVAFLGVVAAWALATAPLAMATPSGPNPNPTGIQDAAKKKAVATHLALEVPTGSVLGKDVTVVAVLRNKWGTPLGNQHLSLFMDNTQIRSDRTDAHGRISFVIVGKRLNQARDYPLSVEYGGSHGYTASRVNAKLTVLAAAIQIQTVPPLPQIRFTLGTESAVTGPDGVAALPVPTVGTYQLAADLNPSTAPDATVKASFVRWLDNNFSASRTIDVSGPATYTMGLRVAYRANVAFRDLDNRAVDATQVEQAQFSAGTGADDIFLNSQTSVSQVWWVANSVARVSNSLIATPVTYRALSVKIHGAEVVNRGQQAWTPSENGLWTIDLLLYPMTIQTRDAFFGMPVSGNLKLSYPDGASVSQSVDSAGQARFEGLPRGVYQLEMHPAAVSPPTPVALSRPQDATLRVITYLDVAAAVGSLLLAVLVLFVIGRGSLIMARRRRRSRAAPVPSDLAEA